MKNLAKKNCIPCKGNVPPLTNTQIQNLMIQLDKGWGVIEEHHLEKEVTFKNFQQALAFTNQIGKLSEEQAHHPDIYLAWGRVTIKIWTPKIDGPTESDFILAAKVDKI
jgi:4a-hydroxytetrahydrobiopterin dehydratase